MEKKELLELMEEALDSRLNEDHLKNLNKKMQEDLLSDYAKKEDVLTYEQLTERQAEEKKKLTFSQWLGDADRIARNVPARHTKNPREHFISNPENGMDYSGLTKIYAGAQGSEPGFIEIDKSLYTSANASGGYLVPTEENRQLIDLTSNWELIPGLCRQVPMRTNVITFPTLTSGITAYWIPEPTSASPSGQSGGVKQASDPVFGQFTITTHVLAILVYVTNQLLDDSDPSIDSILFDLFGRTLGSYFDLACMSGAGTATDPVSGLDTLITTNSVATGATLDFDDIIDLNAGPKNAAKGPSTNQSLTMIANTTAEHPLRKVKDNVGRYIWRDPMQEGAIPNIFGIPLRFDNNVSTTLGAGGDKTKIYTGDFANYAYVGNSMNMVIKANPWMSAAFTGNMTAFLAEFRRGFNVSDETLFAELTGVPIT